MIVAIQSNDDNLPANRLEQLAEEALAVSKKARRHSQNLAGSGFYAKKLADLRILATNEFTDLRVGSAGDTSALAELVAATFSPQTQAKRRTEAVRELIFSLRTTWRGNVATNTPASEESIFPMVLLDQTRRGYLIRIGRQINGCFQHSFFDGCAVMMRRLLEMSIIEAFEGKGLYRACATAGICLHTGVSFLPRRSTWKGSEQTFELPSRSFCIFRGYSKRLSQPDDERKGLFYFT